MMFPISEKDRRRARENMKRNGELEKFTNEIPNPQAPFLNLHSHRDLHPFLLNELPFSTRLSLHSESLQPSSSFSNGFCSSVDGSPYSTPFEEVKNQTPSTHYSNIDGNVVDDMGLSQTFRRMYISGELRDATTKVRGFEVDPDGFGFDDRRNVDEYVPWESLDHVASDFGLFESSSHGVPVSFDDGMSSNVLGLWSGYREDGSMESYFGHDQSNALCSGLSYNKNQTNHMPQKSNEQGSGSHRRGVHLQNQSEIRPYLGDAFGSSRHCETDYVEIEMPNPRGKSPELNSHSSYARVFENGHSLSISDCPLLTFGSSSLAEVQGYIYYLAMNQYGCRFLQKVLDEGKCQDIQIIFEEIISHVVELMMDPFANYLLQKLLDVCNEEQRLHFVLMATKEPGQLIRISLDLHGTRVVQRLIETVKTRKQISLLKSALEPGFLDLVKDLNGNYVLQRCLQCLSSEDTKFIFVAAAKFCVKIATDRHGCCLLQRCIQISIGKHRDKLVTEISKLVAEICRNGLLLAKDPFGNYVIQYIIELKIPSASARLNSQFKGNYAQLSKQKFSSHVVEQCLKHFEESRPRIISELITVPHFDRLLQDPFANYVIQRALAVTKGPLHASLVEALRPHMILCASPYSRKIFSPKLLRK